MTPVEEKIMWSIEVKNFTLVEAHLFSQNAAYEVTACVGLDKSRGRYRSSSP